MPDDWAPILAQARALGDQLVVGLISDDEIRAAKGPPVMDYEERKKLVGAVKWVDEIIDGVVAPAGRLTRVPQPPACDGQRGARHVQAAPRCLVVLAVILLQTESPFEHGVNLAYPASLACTGCLLPVCAASWTLCIGLLARRWR